MLPRSFAAKPKLKFLPVRLGDHPSPQVNSSWTTWRTTCQILSPTCSSGWLSHGPAGKASFIKYRPLSSWELWLHDPEGTTSHVINHIGEFYGSIRKIWPSECSVFRQSFGSTQLNVWDTLSIRVKRSHCCPWYHLTGNNADGQRGCNTRSKSASSVSQPNVLSCSYHIFVSLCHFLFYFMIYLDTYTSAI